MTKMDEDKKPTTPLKTLFKNTHELEAFIEVKREWRDITTNTNDRLEILAGIGHGLNLLYERGAERGLKKKEIADLATLHFEGLTAIERSEYRKLDNNYEKVKCFVEAFNIKSGNTSYLISSYIKAVKEDCEECKDIEQSIIESLIPSPSPPPPPVKEIVNTKDIIDSRKAKGVKEVKEAKEAKEANIPLTQDEVAEAASKLKAEIGDSSTKTGFDNIVRPNPLTPREVVRQLGQICNKIKTFHNEGKLNADDSAMIDRHLTSTLQHLADVDDGDDWQDLDIDIEAVV